MTTAYLQNGTGAKKYKVTIIKNDGTKKTVQFGAKGYSDFTKHKDNDRKERYLSRHKKNENWAKSGISTAGFWSRWLLWNKPSISASLTDIKKRFSIKIIKGSIPKKKSPRKSSRKSSRKSPKKSSRKKCKSNQVRNRYTGRCRLRK